MMLSGEAAIGAHPVETVQMMASCACTADGNRRALNPLLGELVDPDAPTAFSEEQAPLISHC